LPRAALTCNPPRAAGYAGADGIADVAVGLRKTTDALHPKLVGQEAVFLLSQQRNYSIARQVKAFLEREGVSPEEAQTNEKTRQRWRELMEARKRERACNAMESEVVKGRVVRFGMIVQFRHASAKKFLYVTRQDAETNVDARAVAIDADAGEAGWFRIMPRLRVHSEGEMVHISDPVSLEHVQTGLRLRTDGELRDGRLELTATLNATALRIELFRAFNARDDEDTLLAAQSVRLIHKEANGFLVAQRRDDTGDTLSYEAHVYTHDTRTSLTAWQLIKADPLDGSACVWGGAVRLRHVSSDTVLMIKPLSGRSRSFAAGKTGRGHRVSLDGPMSKAKLEDDVPVLPSTDLTSEESLFELVPQYTAVGTVNTDQFCRIRHKETGAWLHYEPPDEDDEAEAKEKGDEGVQAVPLVASMEMRDEDVFGFVAVEAAEEDDLCFVKSSAEQLRAFYAQFVTPSAVSKRSDPNQPLERSASMLKRQASLREHTMPDFMGLSDLLGKLIVFVTTGTDELDPFEREGLPVVSRQLMLHENDVLRLTLMIFVEPFQSVHTLTSPTQRARERAPPRMRRPVRRAPRAATPHTSPMRLPTS
jgi:transcription elongation GreA/GreB family factor